MLTPERRARLRELAADSRSIFPSDVIDLLDALDAAEQRVAELERRVSILIEYRDALMEGIGIDPAEINTYSPLALKGIAEVLYAAEQRTLATLLKARHDELNKIISERGAELPESVAYGYARQMDAITELLAQGGDE